MIAQKAQYTPRVRVKPKPEERVRVLWRRLYLSAKARPDKSFGVLYDKVCSVEVLREAWKRVSRKGGCAGVDGKSIRWIREYGVERYLEELREALVEERYRPDKIQRRYIPKPDGRKRPLGIPTVTDRVVETAVKIVIEPLFEADFLECSYGFRPKRSAHQAIWRIEGYLRMGYRWMVDVDLKSYFDTMPHEPLMELVKRRVRDPKVLRLIRRWLKAGVMENGVVEHPELGSPQGGCLSPLLSNIYLHELDKRWQKRTGKIVRYADDFVILCRTEGEARCEYEHLQEVVQKMHLTLNEEKTRVARVRDGFDFLGFSFRVGEYYRRGKRREIMIKLPRAKAVKAMRGKIKEAVKAVPLGEPVREAVEAVNIRLKGWTNYFQICNVWHSLKKLDWYAGEQLRLFLRRKHQRKRTRGGTLWPNDYFHQHYGLYTATQLYSGRC